jgi:hypothetical protein
MVVLVLTAAGSVAGFVAEVGLNAGQPFWTIDIYAGASLLASMLQDLDIVQVWEAAEDRERRVLIEELVEWVTVYPDHLEVTVAGTLNRPGIPAWDAGSRASR